MATVAFFDGPLNAMLSDTDVNFSDQYDTLSDHISQKHISSIAYLSPKYTQVKSPKDSNNLSCTYIYNSSKGNAKHVRKRSQTVGKKNKHRSSLLSQSSYYRTMSCISPTSFHTTSEINTRMQSPISCCSASFRSNNDISASTLHYQEIREVLLLKNSYEKFGIKITQIGYSFYISMIISDSSAAHAGLKIGDEIIKVNDQPLDQYSNRRVIALIKTSDDELKISFKPRLVIARLRLILLKKSNGKFGLRIHKRSEGIFVAVVVPHSAACQAGIKEGDEIIKINNDLVTEWSQETVTHYLREITTEDSDAVFYIRQINPVEDYRIISHMQTCIQNCIGSMKKLNTSCSICPYDF